jgi:hypothetical protein
LLVHSSVAINRTKVPVETIYQPITRETNNQSFRIE